jgi:hypothetical protein
MFKSNVHPGTTMMKILLQEETKIQELLYSMMTDDVQHGRRTDIINPGKPANTTFL